MDYARSPRLLRIGALVACIMLFALFIFLWVRSYYYVDALHTLRRHRHYSLVSLGGRVQFGFDDISAEVAKDIQKLPTWFVLDASDHWLTDNWLGFDYRRDENGFGAVVPNWFLLLVIGVLAATAVFKRSYRFSLRTLLIAMTLVALVFGYATIGAR